MTPRVLVRRATAALMLAFVAACGSDSGTGPGAFTISAPAASISVPSGASSTANVTVTRSGTFSGPVTLIVEGAPAGVTASAAGVVPANVSVGTINVTVAPGTAVGNATLTIRAKADGQPDQTTQVTVAITAAPTFATTVPSRAVSVTESDSTRVPATVVRAGGFTGVVDLSVSGLPAGVTSSFVTVAADTATVTFRAAAGVTGGVYNVVLNAYNPALNTTVTTPITLTVVEIPGYNVIVSPIRTFAAALPVQGQSTTVNVSTVRRGGYAGAITYALTGTPPLGVTAAFTQTGDNATITYTAAPGAELFTRGMTLTGTAPGLANRVTPVRVTALTGPLLTSGTAVALAAGTADSVYLYAINVPAGATKINFKTAGGTGDIDIYARGNQAPGFSISSAQCTSEGATTAESCDINNAIPGVYFVRIAGFGAFSGASLTVTVTP